MEKTRMEKKTRTKKKRRIERRWPSSPGAGRSGGLPLLVQIEGPQPPISDMLTFKIDLI